MGLAARFAAAGHAVIIGSRSSERAQEAATKIGASGGSVTGAENGDAAAGAEIVILTVPYAGIPAAADAIEPHTRGKIVVSAIAPVEFREGRPVALRPEAGSAAQEVAARLPHARVVSAFQNVDSHSLSAEGTPVDTDVIVSSDDAEARHAVMDLVPAIPGARALSGGRLASARYVEEVTALLITLNRIYKTHTGVRITGVRR